MDCEYITRSLQLATFILARGGPLPALSGQRGALTFHFDDAEERLGWEYEMFQADTPVPVKQLFWAMREIRGHMDRYLAEKGDTVTTAVAAVTTGSRQRR